jgi:hypothetical protein
MSSTEDFSSYSSIEVFEISKEMKQEFYRGCQLTFLIESAYKVYGISKEMAQELHRGLLHIFFIKSAWNQ